MVKQYKLYSRIHSNKLNEAVSFVDTTVLACQHLLTPNSSMLQSMYSKGLMPSNLYVIGKCYSFNEQVAKDLEDSGAHVHRWNYDSHISFDDQFGFQVRSFIDSIASSKLVNGKKLLVIDDGGLVLSELNKKKLTIPTYGVEQTSSGYRLLQNQNVTFPIVNVARSETKLEFESPVIAQHAIDCIQEALGSFDLHGKNALVIGNGFIGKNIASYLFTQMSVSTYDITEHSSKNSLERKLKSTNLVIGCTGSTSLSKELYPYLMKDAILCSVSSSDREFDSVNLRLQVEKNSDPHAHLHIGKQVLLNSGFPITFRGKPFEGDESKMIVTHSLMLEGAYQALSSKSTGFEDLDALRQFGILYNYIDLN